MWTMWKRVLSVAFAGSPFSGVAQADPLEVQDGPLRSVGARPLAPELRAGPAETKFAQNRAAKKEVHTMAQKRSPFVATAAISAANAHRYPEQRR
jgi:hypothetical protein